MRTPVLLLALVASACASSWSDKSKLKDLTITDGRDNGLGVAGSGLHGAGLVYKGAVYNGDKTVRSSTESYLAKSVITGKDSFYPQSLPQTLKTPFLVPDSTHPNLAFWYTPDAFERDGVADGSKVKEWRNVANICYQGFTQVAPETADGYDVANDCTYAKKSNTQTVPFGNNKHVEALGQTVVERQPIYKKNVLNGHGVVRFRRADKHGVGGQVLEMNKRCADVKCEVANSNDGFVPLVSTKSWTNSETAAESKFTIFLVMKTYQQPGDVNPMGILIVSDTSRGDGLGLYKVPSRCKSVLKSTIAATGTSGTILGTAGKNHLYLKADTWGLRSQITSEYNGMYVHIQDSALEPSTLQRFTHLVCKIDQYIVSGVLKTSLTTGTETTVTLQGGAGTVAGWTPSDTLGQWPTLRFGKISSAHAAGDIAITAVGVNTNLIDTDLTIASSDFAIAKVVMAGSMVFLATGTETTEFYTAIVSGCTGTKITQGTEDNTLYTADTGTSTVVDIIPGDGVQCKGDVGAGLAPFGKFSVLSSHYGEAGKVDDAGDAACEKECAEFGCDASTGNFGNPTKVLVGELLTALNGATTTEVVLKGGRGKIAGWKPYDVDDSDSGAATWPHSTGGVWPKIRFGNAGVEGAGAAADIAISAAVAQGDDTKLTIASTDFSGAVQPVGTKIYMAINGGANPDFTNDYYKNKCVKKWGSGRHLQDPDKQFRIVSITVDNGASKVYIDGLHDGCNDAATCTVTAPSQIAGATPKTFMFLKVGMLAAVIGGGQEHELRYSYANVDIAEMIIYNTKLSPEEMDRVGNYLSVKFDLPQFRLNSFIRSPTRSVAVSAKPGCDHVLHKSHQSSICDGLPGCTLTEDTLVLSKRWADSDTDDYFNGMRLYITGGGDRVDKTKLSAKGQSCHITDYVAATRTATCDLTNTGQSGKILWGGVDFPCVVAAQCGAAVATDVMALTDTILTVSWVPTVWNVPYYAAIGDPAADREIVKVTQVAIKGNRYQLTVIRGFAGAPPAELTWANGKALLDVATITYAQSAVMRDVAANDLNIVVAGFLASCGVHSTDPRCALASDRLPLAADIAGDQLKIVVTKKTPTKQSLAVTNLRYFEWKLAGGGTVTGTAGMLISSGFTKIDVVTSEWVSALNVAAPLGLVAKDLLLLGSIADGEVVMVKTIDDADSLTISRGHALPTVMPGRKTWTLKADATAGATTLVIQGTFDILIYDNALVLMGTVESVGGVLNEIVIVTNAVADTPIVGQTTLTVTRGEGFKLEDGTARAGAAAQTIGTTMTLLSKAHAANTVVKLIGKDGEPLVVTINAAAAAQTAVEGVIVDFAIIPLGGATAAGTDYVGGSGISTYKLEPCDPYLPPYVTDGPIQIVQGQEYLKSPGQGFGGSFTADTRTSGNAFWMNADGVTASSQTGPGTGEASGGTVLELNGWYLAPMDLAIEGTTNDVMTRGSTVERTENYLLVTVGARPNECADPTQTTPCADGKYESREAALTCQLVEMPGGFCADDWSKPCKCLHLTQCADDCGGTTVCMAGPAYGAASENIWYPTSKTSMRCALPGTLNANQDLNIYWHGIKTRFTNWYRPNAPVVTKLVPSSASFSGGDTVTIMGSNFGPREVWTAVNKAGTKTMTTRTATVSFVGKSMAQMCETLVYVSDKQIICKVPALANQKQDLDKTSRTVKVSVVVDAGGLRSHTDSSGMLTYSNVPSYFACNSNQVSETGKNECFSCCRSSCIVDEFALGAQKGGATYSHCDTACYTFCGFTAK